MISERVSMYGCNELGSKVADYFLRKSLRAERMKREMQSEKRLIKVKERLSENVKGMNVVKWYCALKMNAGSL